MPSRSPRLSYLYHPSPPPHRDISAGTIVLHYLTADTPAKMSYEEKSQGAMGAESIEKSPPSSHVSIALPGLVLPSLS